ncbi:polysaccharide biosynthesis tyrosine autokinase [Arthrobacter sp. MPF02]|uniref:polysaccharide biosynthesis tyrosine autokinase n=1 Tax=Arthrobacter sp. MPF02 TaxID=3388492 RepID=UPI00398552B9
MNLGDYIRVLRRNWMLLAATTMIGLLLGGLASVLVKPTYTSETQLFVAIQSSGSIQELQQGNTFSQARVQSYVKMVQTPIVLQPAIDALGLRATPDELASRVKASTDLNTVLVNIAVTDQSPVQSAAAAQAIAQSLIKAIDTLEKPQNGGVSPVTLSVVRPAVAPSAPSAPNTRLNLLIGLVLGLAAGLGGAVLRSTLDSRIRGEADLRQVTSLPLLGGIAFDTEASKRPLLTQVATQSPRAESFRQLRTNLKFANVSGKAKSVLITSSLPGEGKSTTAVNLAIAMAQAGGSVCLVDADLRRPMVGDYMGLENNVGLTTALIGAADTDDVLQHWGDNGLFVITSGQIPPNPSELLGSAEMKALIEHLEQTFDAVIIDAPPLLPVTDATVLAQHVGGVALVVGSQKITRNNLERSIGALELVRAEILGTILNQIPAKGPDAYSYGYAAYAGELQVPSKRDEVPHLAAQVKSMSEQNHEDFIDSLVNTAPAAEKRFRIREDS